MKMAEAIFSADCDPNAFLNSVEIFAVKTTTHLLTCKGTDVCYTKFGVNGEFVAQCKEPEDVEMHHTFSYDDLSCEAVKKKAETALLQGFAGFGARRPRRPAPAVSLREFYARRRRLCGNFAQNAAAIRRKGAGDPAPFHGLQRNVGAEAVSRQGWTSVRSWTARSGPPSARAESTVSSPFLMASSAALMAAFRSSLA